ncbi:TetR/AcrR family transcriptional regulator [Nocardioides taihuensis]|uniref:TetR/AcrR family transcriptional regulator n=1 Tax=Nocardioides taihuensis TaxID=1835606 RepID=A0ABW0BJ49_9ACTN
MTTGTGRPRDATIDVAVLEATLRQLARDGMGGLSLAAVAAEAGTTRPAIYRRWADKSALVVDAVAHLAAVDPPVARGEPFADLVAELEHFRHCITEAAALPLAGLMMGDGVTPAVRDQYAREVVRPRRARIRACLESALARGELSPDADLAVAGSFLTGSWYAFALSDTTPPDDWARRTATLVWRACGGSPP